jgi:hypothetical protein
MLATFNLALESRVDGVLRAIELFKLYYPMVLAIKNDR